jgi:DNA-binding transcriptional MerR regulator
VVRKRSAHVRWKDRGRKRGPRRRTPLTGWTLAQLAELAQVAPRTIGEYTRRGLMTSPQFRGTATRYQRAHLLRLLAIRGMKNDGTASIKAIKLRLETMGQAELERWVLSRPLEPHVASALSTTTEPRSNDGRSPDERSTDERSTDGTNGTTLPGLLGGSANAPSKAPLEVWRCVQLMPGLELSLRADAAPVVRQVAAHLYNHLERLIADALAKPQSAAEPSRAPQPAPTGVD